MAANMKAVKLRIKSVESTMQITKAMELVASSKLRKAKERADTCRPYFQELYRTAALRADTTPICSDALRQRPKEKRSGWFRSAKRQWSMQNPGSWTF